MHPWVFNVYMNSVMKEVKMGGMDESENFGGGERVEIAWPLVWR